MEPNSLPTVFMIVSGQLQDGLPILSSFVQTQANSLRDTHWDVVFGVVDDRTSMHGIVRNIKKIQQQIVARRPCLVHAQYGSVIAAIARLAKKQLPLIISFCGDDLLGTPQPGLGWRLREKVARQLGLWAARHAQALVVKSPNLLRALPAGLREKAIILPNGVDTDWFTPQDKSACRIQLGWSAEEKVVLFNASHNDNQLVKNPTLARETVALVSQKVPQAALRTMSNVSPEHIRLMLNAADCLLVTSLHEGSPNIVKEAMACNLPVVSVPCGDVAERLQETSPGAVCSYDTDTLAEAVCNVLQTATRSNGREQLFAQGLTARDVAGRLRQLYLHAQRGAA